MKYIFIVLGIIFIAISIIGIVLPILPTTPFLLAASVCFEKNKSMTFKTKLYILIPVTILLIAAFLMMNNIYGRIMIIILIIIKYYYFVFKIKTE